MTKLILVTEELSGMAMPREDEDYIELKRADRVYVSKEFGVGGKRFISRVLDDDERVGGDFIDGEWVLRVSRSGKQQIKLLVTTDDRKVRNLVLQRFQIAGDGSRPTRLAHFSLHGKEIELLLELVGLALHGEFPRPDKVRLDAAALQHFDLDRAGVQELLRKDPDLLAELVEHDVTSRDVVATAYRRRMLDRFEMLLRDPEYFDAYADGGSREKVWQNFFELNRWIFGYGLFHISTSTFEGKKLEQIVAGASIANRGKRADALLRTNGRIASLCFVEVKTHDTPLLHSKAYRPGAWPVSAELAGAVAQVHKTVDMAEAAIKRKLTITDDDGSPTGEEAYLCRPRSAVVCGDLSQFVTDAGVNEEKFFSFELYRRQLSSPELITFDELLERARLIVDAGA